MYLRDMPIFVFANRVSATAVCLDAVPHRVLNVLLEVQASIDMHTEVFDTLLA